MVQVAHSCAALDLVCFTTHLSIYLGRFCHPAKISPRWCVCYATNLPVQLVLVPILMCSSAQFVPFRYRIKLLRVAVNSNDLPVTWLPWFLWNYFIFKFVLFLLTLSKPFLLESLRRPIVASNLTFALRLTLWVVTWFDYSNLIKLFLVIFDTRIRAT